MAELVTQLSDSLLAQLQKEKCVLLTTIDSESGGPANNAISWIYAVNAKTVRFAVDQRSRIIGNIKANSRVSISFFAIGSVHAVYGEAAVRVETLEDVPFKMSCIDLTIETIRDVMFYGSRISVEPEYEKTYDKRAAEKLDNQVYAAMKKA